MRGALLYRLEQHFYVGSAIMPPLYFKRWWPLLLHEMTRIPLPKILLCLVLPPPPPLDSRFRRQTDIKNPYSTDTQLSSGGVVGE